MSIMCSTKGCGRFELSRTKAVSCFLSNLLSIVEGNLTYFSEGDVNIEQERLVEKSGQVAYKVRRSIA